MCVWLGGGGGFIGDLFSEKNKGKELCIAQVLFYDPRKIIYIDAPATLK